jgi:excinuclease ABC subunit C
VLPDVVQQKLDALPAQPGVYVFRDRRGATLYVGKASSLRSRVRSYFAASMGDTRFFIATLAAEIGDLETYVTRTEKEAALLENNLIKEHQPRYNVKLRDDKEYLSLRLDPKAAWPRLEVVRRPRQDGAHYFGPYHSATAARATLRLVNRHFQLRTCTDTELAARVRPCLQYQIKRCPGPCVLPVDRAHYGEQAGAVTMFLDGRHDELVKELAARMTESASKLEYEQAGVYRDQIRAVEQVREEQRVTSARDVDQDVIGLYREGEQIEIALLVVRGGRLVGVRTWELVLPLPDEEVVASFVAEYYGRGALVPDEVLLPLSIEAMDGLAGALGERRQGRAPRVHHPQRGALARLLEMANENAQHAFREKARAQKDVEERLAEVQRRLRLPALPRRIECIDVSHTGGTDTVAAIVAMREGALDRRAYKSFHVRRVDGGDDYGAMYEALTRRFRRGRDGEGGWELPDLLVVDGGRGQLGVALTALRDLGVTGLPVVGLAKEKENVRGDKLVDRVYLPGQKNPVPLREGSSALFYLAQLRDEAHRASNALRVKLGKRRRLRSGLADVPGVGPRTAALLLRTLGSLRAVLAADEAALTAAGATTRQAKAIAAHFAAGTTASEPPLEADGADDPASATEQDDLALDALTLDGLPLDEEESDTLPADARPALDGGDDGSEDAAVERAFTQG